MGGDAAAGRRARSRSFAGAATDSRGVDAGQLFFALPGERVDGFEFAAQAAAAGAAGVVVAAGRGSPAGCDDVAVIAVDDPRRALGDLARAVRAALSRPGRGGDRVERQDHHQGAGARRRCAPLGAVLRTPGNLNTDVGLPLTILSAQPATRRAWVLEMAMRARGEIAYLAEIARPDIGVITNVAGAHLETLGSIDEVARAKGELFAALAAQGERLVFPADDPLIAAQAAVRRARRGGSPSADAQPATCASSTSSRRAPAAPSCATRVRGHAGGGAPAAGGAAQRAQRRRRAGGGARRWGRAARRGRAAWRR